MPTEKPGVLLHGAWLVALFGHHEERLKRVIERGCVYLVNAEREFRDQTLCLGARIGEGKRRIPTDRMTLAIRLMTKTKDLLPPCETRTPKPATSMVPLVRLTRAGAGVAPMENCVRRLLGILGSP